MKTLAKILIILTIFLVGFKTVEAASGINRKINFQGKVVNKGAGATDGTNINDGNYNVTFKIWDSLSAGTSLWTETWNSGTTQVAVTSGIFQVSLGTYATFPPGVNFNTDSLFVSMNFNGDGDMTPRIQMAAVPYAFNAEKVMGLTVTATDGTLSIGNSKTITFGDNFTTIAGVGITLNQSLSTTDSPNFAGLSFGGTAVTSTAKELNYLHNLAVGNTGAILFANGVGITQLTIGVSGYFLMSSGTNPVWVANSSVGTTYSYVNGVNDPGTHVVGLGGSLTVNTQIGTSNYNLSFVGLGGTQSLFIGASGFVGIGNTNPAASIDITQTALSSTAEEIAHFSIKDDNVSYLSIRNGSTSDGLFAPQLRFRGSSTNIAGNIQGMITTDTGNNPAWVFTSQLASAAIVTRPLIAFRNYTTDVATLMANGSFGLGTTNPAFTLQVGGTGSLGVGGSVTFSGIPIGVGSTILYIDSNGNLVQGTMPVGGSYTATNGLNLNGSVFGLGGTLTNLTKINLNSFSFGLFGAGNVGIGTTNPASKLEIDSGTNGVSGLKFSQINSGTTTGATNNKVLTVDVNGNVFIADDQKGTGSLPTGSAGGQTLRFDVGTSLWTANSNMLVGTNGSIQILGTTTDIVKTSTGIGASSDFEGLGATFAFTHSTNNLIAIQDIGMTGGVSGVFSTISLGTTKAQGAGGQI